MRRVLAAAVAVFALGAGTAGCTAGDALSDQARAGDEKNYVAGDGSVTQLAESGRDAPVELSGTTPEGEVVDVAAWRGAPVVLNVWYAACAPCRAEAPDLAEVATEYSPQGVRFLGVNTRDGAETALAFERTYGVGYPSILDVGDGAALLALRGQVPPQAVPSTLVLDDEGRVAARVLGQVEASTLDVLVEDVLAEDP